MASRHEARRPVADGAEVGLSARVVHGHPMVAIGLRLLIQPCGEIGFIREEIDNHLSGRLDAIEERLGIRLHLGL